MRVSVVHTTRLEYTADVVEGVMDTRLGPHSDAHQRWERHEVRLSPAGSIRPYVDGFGNRAHLMTVPRPHRYVEVIATGIAETQLSDPFAQPYSLPRPLTSSEKFDYLRASRLVALPDGVRDLAEPHRPRDGDGALEAVRALMELIFQQFSYVKDVTTVTTTVPELLETRNGVCQDFAHVLIAMCRSLGIPARYVSGYIVSSQSPPNGSQTQTLGGMTQTQTLAGFPQSGQASTPQRPTGSPGGPGSPGNPATPSRGAGASHAWAEAWLPTHGWRGFDPTNNLLASESHVKMAIGRDYGDVPPTRGTFRGSAEETLSVDVDARPIE